MHERELTSTSLISSSEESSSNVNAHISYEDSINLTCISLLLAAPSNTNLKLAELDIGDHLSKLIAQ